MFYNLFCESDGIGRHNRLKICCQYWRRGSTPLSRTNLCECGGMAYTAVSKTVAERFEGSNPSARTKKNIFIFWERKGLDRDK